MEVRRYRCENTGGGALTLLHKESTGTHYGVTVMLLAKVFFADTIFSVTSQEESFTLSDVAA